MRGLSAPEMAIDDGTVIVETRSEPQPSPGLRTVRLYPVDSLGELPARLVPWRGFIQGVASIGDLPASLADALRDLGVTRIAPAGALQRPEADWDGADSSGSQTTPALRG